MKTKHLLYFVLLAFSNSTMASNFYLAAHGYNRVSVDNIKNIDIKKFNSSSVALGYGLLNFFRLEVKGDYLFDNTFQDNTNSTATFSGPIGFLNTYIDFASVGPISFYIGTGFGISMTEPRIVGSSSYEKNNRMIISWIAGVSLSLLNIILLDLNYYFLNFGLLKNQNNSFPINSHNIAIGLRVPL